jgi:hypothetical protein
MKKVTIDSGIAFQKAKSVRFPELLLPPFLQAVSQASFKLGRHSVGLTRFVQSDAVADIVHHNLAWITARQMLGKLPTNRQRSFVVDVFVERFQQFFAGHGVVRKEANVREMIQVRQKGYSNFQPCS